LSDGRRTIWKGIRLVAKGEYDDSPDDDLSSRTPKQSMAA